MLTLYYSIVLHVKLISFYHISMLTLHITCTLVVTSVMLWSIECKKQRLIFIESRYLAHYKHYLSIYLYMAALDKFHRSNHADVDYAGMNPMASWIVNENREEVIEVIVFLQRLESKIFRLQTFWHCPRIVAWILMIGMHATVCKLHNAVWKTAGPLNEQGETGC